MPKVPSIHELYEAAVQHVETDLNFARRVYKRHNKMEPKKKGNRLDATLKTTKTKKLGWKLTKNLKDYLLNENQ